MILLESLESLLEVNDCLPDTALLVPYLKPFLSLVYLNVVFQICDKLLPVCLVDESEMELSQSFSVQVGLFLLLEHENLLGVLDSINHVKDLLDIILNFDSYLWWFKRVRNSQVRLLTTHLLVELVYLVDRESLEP